MKRILIVVAVAVLLGGLAYWLVQRLEQGPQNTLELSGHIEATETDLSFKVPGKVAAVHFCEGDEFKAGQVVAELEAKDLKDNVALAEATLAQAEANMAKLLAGSRPQEIREAQAAADQAQADLTNKRLDYERNQDLFREGVVAASRRDNAEAAYKVAQEGHRRAMENLRLVREGYRKEDIAAGRAALENARANLELARTRLGYARLVAPVDGVVLVRDAEPGEVLAIGSPVLTTANLDRVYLEAYIPETDLAKVRYLQRAYVTTDTYPGRRYPAWVSFISSQAEFTPKTVETKKERVTLVYRTKIRVENPRHELKPGMPADGFIILDGKR